MKLRPLWPMGIWLAILLILGGYIFTSTSATPYQHNWWKRHRWASDAYRITREQQAAYDKCVADNGKWLKEHPDDVIFGYCIKPPDQGTSIISVQSNGEKAEFDICLEHGELRRIK